MCHSQLHDARTVQHQLEQTFVLGLLVLMNHATKVKRVLKLVSGNARAAYKFTRFVSMTYTVLSALTLSVGQREGYAAAKTCPNYPQRFSSGGSGSSWHKVIRREGWLNKNWVCVCVSTIQWPYTKLTELRFYIPLNTKYAILNMLFPANLLVCTDKNQKPGEITTNIYNKPALIEHK